MCFLCFLAHVEPKQLCQDHVIASWLSSMLSDLFVWELGISGSIVGEFSWDYRQLWLADLPAALAPRLLINRDPASPCTPSNSPHAEGCYPHFPNIPEAEPRKIHADRPGVVFLCITVLYQQWISLSLSQQRPK